MEKAHEFNFYFTDERLGKERLARMQLLRTIVHKLYPEVHERVAYAMPGFYPKKAVKATHQLFLVMANKNWLGIYGTQGLSPERLAPWVKDGISFGKGNLHIPYDMSEKSFRELLQLIMDYNFERHGLEA